MRIPSGVTDQYIYFVAVDATDLKTRETGLNTFTVYRSRNGAAAAVMTTPTINETDTTNMPGVYELLLDEDMTIDSGDDSQEMVFHITHAGMAPVTRSIELYRPKITAGETLTSSSGEVTPTAASKAGYALSNTGIDALFTRALTESYAADGATFTVAQALYEIAQSIGDFSISGTTITVKQRDGTTTAATYTLDDGTNPTSRTRAT
jgi:hypothetical protein